MNNPNRVAMMLKDRPEYLSKPKPLTFPPTDTVKAAVEAMSAKGFGSVIIVDPDDKVIGVVTERDIMAKVVRNDLPPDTTPLKDIMTAEPRVAKETDEVTDWMRIMANERFRRLPVVDDEGRIKAVFTQGDFVSYTWPELMYQAGQMAKASVFKNWHVWLIGGGIALYSILMIIVIGAVTG